MPNRAVLTLTFDTNCINLRKEKSALNELERLAEQGIIQIAATPEMLVDLERDESRHAEKRREKARLLHKRIHNESTKPTPPGSSEKTLEDPITREKVERGLLHWLQTLFPSGRPNENMVDDILHVLIHTVWKRDIFVTTDKKDILKRREEFRKLGAIVCTHEEALQRVKDHISLPRVPNHPLHRIADKAGSR